MIFPTSGTNRNLQPTSESVRALSQPLTQSLFGILLVVGTILLSGCQMAGPNFGPQGTFEYQRSRAVLHDPFPNNEVAPPIVGGRGPGYSHPLPEPKNNQEFRNRGARVQPYYGF